MGIEDIQISEELETNAPSIKYTGNEGPKSPQEEQMMQQQMMEQQMMEQEEQMMAPVDYSSPAYRAKLIQQLMDTGGLDYGSASNEADRIIKIKLRPKAAYGGIMGRDGRRQYGLGSKFKKFVRKIIPNEVADIAVKAAPFVAPFNPIAAGLMSGIGSFDQTGKIGSSLKSGLMNYGMGQVARGIGGGTGNLQTGFNPMTGSGVQGAGFFSSPISNQGGIGKMFSDKLTTAGGSMAPGADGLTSLATAPGEGALTLEQMTDFNKIPVKNLGETGSILSKIKAFALDNKLLTGLAAGTLGATALMGNMEPEEIQDLQRGEGLDVEGIRAEVIEAMKDTSGEKLKAIRIKYPFLGTQRSKDVSGLAMGGRIGKAEGGIMDLGGMEKDYRAEGGFVPIGKAEKADDVPARLSVNEFVFTADAVRNAGGGDIDKGAEVMENMMKNLEQGGQLSEESQGMQGARNMFQTSQRLGEVV
jgi:hypothetical protein